MKGKPMGIGIRKKTYLVDLLFSVTREVDAVSPEAAEQGAELQLQLDGLGIPKRSDVTEVRCVGTVKTDENGKPHYEYFS